MEEPGRESIWRKGGLLFLAPLLFGSFILFFLAGGGVSFRQYDGSKQVDFMLSAQPCNSHIRYMLDFFLEKQVQF